jgi:hypothetical protein
MPGMTDGEKMIWAAVFGHTYSAHEALFRIDMRGKNHDIQREDHRTQSAALATEAAARAVVAARGVTREDVDDDAHDLLNEMIIG